MKGILIRRVMKDICSFRHLPRRRDKSLHKGQSRTHAEALKQRLCLSSFQRLSLIVALQSCLQERIPFIRTGAVYGTNLINKSKGKSPGMVSVIEIPNITAMMIKTNNTFAKTASFFPLS